MAYHMLEKGAVIKKPMGKKNCCATGEGAENLGNYRSGSIIYSADMIVSKGKVQSIEGKVGFCKRTVVISHLKA